MLCDKLKINDGKTEFVIKSTNNEVSLAHPRVPTKTTLGD